MDELTKKQFEDRLRGCVGRFINDKSPGVRGQYEFLQKIKKAGGRAFLCGGAIRDICLSSGKRRIVPRDLDIVMGFQNLKGIVEHFPEYKYKWNCYGGVNVTTDEFEADLWELTNTWAVKEKHVKVYSFKSFPETTFLNTEAVVVELFPKKGRKREVYSKGFFEAISSKTVEINLEKNPNPMACLIRAIKTAHRYNFMIGPRLAKYIAQYKKEFSDETIVEAYRNRYDFPLKTEELTYLFKRVNGQFGHLGEKKTLGERVSPSGQMHLWDFRRKGNRFLNFYNKINEVTAKFNGLCKAGK